MTGHKDFKILGEEAAKLPAGSEGVLCLDWFHGCRTPLMNGSLHGSFSGLNMHHRPEHLYRALLEASAMGVRWIVEILREGGVEVNRFVATGGLPHHNPLVVQVYADVLNETISVHPSTNGPALGAAILGGLAAGIFDSSQAAIRSMSVPKKGTAKIYKPNRRSTKTYDDLYREYRRLGDFYAS